MSNHNPLHISAQTKSFKSLALYAIPYALGYAIFPILLDQINFALGALFVTAVLNILVIMLFRRREKRFLEKIECSRIAIIVILLTFIISIIVVMVFLSNQGISITQIFNEGITNIIGIAGLVALVINYAIVFYSLWWMQCLWKR